MQFHKYEWIGKLMGACFRGRENLVSVSMSRFLAEVFESTSFHFTDAVACIVFHVMHCCIPLSGYVNGRTLSINFVVPIMRSHTADLSRLYLCRCSGPAWKQFSRPCMTCFAFCHPVSLMVGLTSNYPSVFSSNVCCVQ